MVDCKVIVVGGGPAGLACATLLAQAGHAVKLVTGPAAKEDHRTVALMQPALRLLKRIGAATDALQAASAPLRQLAIEDDTGALVSAPDLKFSAHELELDCFGWNVPLTALAPALLQTANTSSVEIISDVASAIDIGPNEASVVLQSGATLGAPLLIGADGSRSLVRKTVGIETDVERFDQEALVGFFSHSGPHNDCSTERHRVGGLFTTVPMPGNASSFVWMAPPHEIAALRVAPERLAMEIQLATHGKLGQVSKAVALAAFPMVSQKARRFAASRVMLVGEAGHAFPPIGAQGLNLSLRDAGHVADVVAAHVEDPGSEPAMKAYDALRQNDVNERQAIVAMMNHSLLAQSVPLPLLRAAGLAAVAAIPPLRHWVIQQGLSPEARLPHAMRQ